MPMPSCWHDWVSRRAGAASGRTISGEDLGAHGLRAAVSTLRRRRTSGPRARSTCSVWLAAYAVGGGLLRYPSERRSRAPSGLDVLAMAAVSWRALRRHSAWTGAGCIEGQGAQPRASPMLVLGWASSAPQRCGGPGPGQPRQHACGCPGACRRSATLGALVVLAAAGPGALAAASWSARPRGAARRRARVGRAPGDRGRGTSRT